MTDAFVILVVAFLVFTAWREREHSEERRELAQRIQAPERAVATQGRREEDKPPRRYVPIALDDDKAVLTAHGEEIEENDDGVA